MFRKSENWSYGWTLSFLWVGQNVFIHHWVDNDVMCGDMVPNCIALPCIICLPATFDIFLRVRKVSAPMSHYRELFLHRDSVPPICQRVHGNTKCIPLRIVFLLTLKTAPIYKLKCPIRYISNLTKRNKILLKVKWGE